MLGEITLTYLQKRDAELAKLNHTPNLTEEHKIKLAVETGKNIPKLEGGPPLCKVDGLWYEKPLWVAERFKDMFAARASFDDRAAGKPHNRVYGLLKKQNCPKPEDRYNLYRLHFSATFADWYRFKSQKDQVRIRSAIYNKHDCPYLGVEWNSVLMHFHGQQDDESRFSPNGRAFHYYRFVEPVIQMIDMKPPKGKKYKFERRFDPIRNLYFFNCYHAGMKASEIEALEAVGVVTYAQ